MRVIKTSIILLVLIGISSFSNAQNQAVSFSNSSEYVFMHNHILTGVKTIELWFQPSQTYDSNTPETSTLIYRNTANQQHEVGLYIAASSWAEPGKLVFFLNDGTSTYTVSSNDDVWNGGQWYHVAAVIDTALGMHMYVNGALQDSTNSGYKNGITVDAATPYLGRWGDADIRHFKGQIDELRMWNEPRSWREVNAYRTLSLNSSDHPDLKHYYIFDTVQQSGHIADQAGSISIISNATLQPGYTDIAYHDDRVAMFNGHSSFIDIGTVSSTDVRTVSFKFKPIKLMNEHLPEAQTLIYRNTADQRNEWGVYIAPEAWTDRAGHLVFSVNGNSTTPTTVKSNQNTWNDEQWYSVAAVIDPVDGLKLYVNGVLQSQTNSGFTSAVAQNSESLTLGRWGNSNIRYFEGELDDVRLFRSAKSQSEIMAMQCGTFYPASADSINVSYSFDYMSTFPLAYDESGNQTSGIRSDVNYVPGGYCLVTGNEVFDFKSTEDYHVVSLYPNPSSGSIQLSSKSQGQIVIRNAIGRVVEITEAQETMINLSEGMYFMSFYQNGQLMETQKLIVQ